MRVCVYERRALFTTARLDADKQQQKWKEKKTARFLSNLSPSPLLSVSALRSRPRAEGAEMVGGVLVHGTNKKPTIKLVALRV